MAQLYYFHDPMCSWCWGFRPTLERLLASLPTNVTPKYVLGGLAPDSDDPMPVAQKEMIRGHWQTIELRLGTEFNYDFWTRCVPRRSTYPACRAVIAAANQGREAAMIAAIQRAYYLEARNPSDRTALADLAAELGLDTEKFRSDMEATATEIELQCQIGFSRQSGVSGFPSLMLSDDGAIRPVTVDYNDHLSMLEQIERLVASSGARSLRSGN